jgi:hypothetical protein
MTATVECRSVYHREVAPGVHVDVYRTVSGAGVAYSVGLDGTGLHGLAPEEATQLAGVVLLAGKFARREQDMADFSGKRRRSA